MAVFFSKRFSKQRDKLQKPIRKKLPERLLLFADEPFHQLLHNHSVDGVFPGCRSINITGDYRAIFTQRDEQILFLQIGTHSELYG